MNKEKFKKQILQIIKFLIVGFNNTSIDFLILNLLMWFLNIYQGGIIIFLNIFAFSVAVTHSYLVNRFWVFREKLEKTITFSQVVLPFLVMLILFNLWFIKNPGLTIFFAVIYFSLVILLIAFILKKFILNQQNFSQSGWQFFQFVIISLVGVSINTSIVYFFTSHLPPFFNLSRVLWANFAKVLATMAATTWNFLGYKFIIFKENK